MDKVYGGSRGLNNHNWWNIKQPGSDPAKWWAGSTGSDDLDHAVFISPVYSARACIRQLSRYQVRDNLTTLRAIFGVYAPIDDAKANNDPDAYANFVAGKAGKVGISARSPIVLFRPDGRVKDADRLVLVLKGMAEFEQFAGFVAGEDVIRSGIALYGRDFC